MSSILSGYIQSELKAAFPADGFYNNPQFADAMARAIQKYLASNVKTQPNVSGPGAGPVGHVHPLIPDALNAP
jgi:hypothetical protein